jgi:hypothetical protein
VAGLGVADRGEQARRDVEALAGGEIRAGDGPGRIDGVGGGGRRGEAEDGEDEEESHAHRSPPRR